MFKTIDDIMYITDGNNPFRYGLIYGTGGLGYKPTPYNMIGGMIGGMSKPDLYTGNFTTEINDEKDDEIKNVDMKDFVENYLDLLPKDQQIPRLLNELNDINFQLEIGKYVITDDESKEKILEAIKPITDYFFLNQDELNPEELEQYNKIYTEFKKYGINLENLNDLDFDKADIIENKNKGEIYEYLDKITENAKKDNPIEFDKDKDYLRGDVSEDVNIELPIITDIIEGKKGNVYSSKNVEFYNPDFLKELYIFINPSLKYKDIDIEQVDDKIYNNLFDKFIIDAIRYNKDGTTTLIELKSQKNNNYNTTKFNQGKYLFDDGKSVAVMILYNVEDKNGKNIPKTYDQIKESDKIKSINGIYGNFYSYGTKVNSQPIKVLNNKKNDINYTLLDFSKNGIRYSNAIKNFNTIRRDVKKAREEEIIDANEKGRRVEANVKARLNDDIFNYLPESYEKTLLDTIKEYKSSIDPRVRGNKKFQKYNYLKKKLLI